MTPTFDDIPDVWNKWYAQYSKEKGLALSTADYYAYGYICGRFAMGIQYPNDDDYMMGFEDGMGDVFE